jgi:hypothetical protein
VWLWNDRIQGIRLETNLADEIDAFRAGRPYSTPEWMNSRPYIVECEECGNRPDLKYETLRGMVADAVRSWELVLYI